jgi:protein ImuB
MSRVVRRVACIALPEIRIEIVREKERISDPCFSPLKSPNFNRQSPHQEGRKPLSESPLAIVVARPDGTLKTERDVLGGTRLDFVSVQAHAFGVHAGQTVAAARAKYANLQIRVLARGAVREALARVAEAALAFGPTVAFSDAEDVVWVEVGGCAHLKGGERELAEALGERVRAMGHASRIAIAGGPRIAAAMARFASSRTAKEAKGGRTFVVPEGKEAEAVRALPIAALALDGDTSSWLSNLGFPFCGDLQKLPRRSFGIRLGRRAHDVLQLLDGEDRAPIDAWRPPEVPEERIELEGGAPSTEALAFVMKALCDRLATRLEGRAMAALRIEIVLTMDRGLYEATGNAMPPVSMLEVKLPSPIAHAADLLATVRARIDRETVAAPVIAVALRAAELVHASEHTLDMFAPEPRAWRALRGLVSELTAELGETSLGTLALGDTWIAGERSRLVPFGATSAASRHPLMTSTLEPSRVVPPFCIPRGWLAETELLVRIEAVQWWRFGLQKGDLVAAWLPSHRDMKANGDNRDVHHRESKPRDVFGDVGALGWIELCERGNEARLRGWID